MINHSRKLFPLLGRFYYSSVVKSLNGKVIKSTSADIGGIFNQNYSSKSILHNQQQIEYRYYSLNRFYSTKENEEEEDYDEDNDDEDELSPEDEAKYQNELKKLNLTSHGRRKERNELRSEQRKELLGEGKEPNEAEDDSFLTRVCLSELHDAIMNYPENLYKEIRYQLHRMWQEDPEFWNYERLSKVFKLHPGRVVALIRFVEMEEQEKLKGARLYYDLEDENIEIDGVRINDDYLGENDKKYKKSQASIRSGLADNIEYLHGKKPNATNLQQQQQKPDPLHEIPTKIPENYPEKPIYFRGPTFVVPRKKNVVFVDTSRDRFTKKVNPDPMVLIQGIDGSLRTPSSGEKLKILQKVRPKKVPRDYQSLIDKPLPDNGMQSYKYEIEFSAEIAEQKKLEEERLLQEQKLAEQQQLEQQQQQQQA
ncbi:hypothetical protein DLAC_03524 [Tieghemostelium lacteum]|uniref:Uncharacterized protein n=1 Tax=Tieghemostelium lacteum TaxID=361077 RepID=A0A152A1C4_TIELA|nr:hypothetical protein DLAC_03524 [Tieghemostelium lacteum]|eukprot:KYR00026.1 hypothetical protein DLAC_03524 [Tieghemostelium lacteum]